MDKTMQKIEYRLHDLPTRSVTLFPSRAQVIRELNNVPLKRGINEVIVVGLTPTVDEHSIKVHGTGPASSFIDVAVELLPNRDVFEDVYPESDDEDNEKDDGENEKNKFTDDGKENNDLKKSIEALKEKLTRLRDDRQRFKEAIASAAMRLKILDAFGLSLADKDSKVSIKDGLNTYQEERQKAFNDHMDATISERKVGETIIVHSKELKHLEDNLHVMKPQEVKQRNKELLIKAESKKEKDRIRKQREQFWPKSCYTVRITLDTSTVTPSSPGRPSVTSTGIGAKLGVTEKIPSPSDSEVITTCDITLTYVTTSVFWSPCYDLALSTTENNARLCFDASLINMTSETWSNCKVILSNSQTMLSSMSDTVPSLEPWHIKLSREPTILTIGNTLTSNGILLSREERAYKAEWNKSQNDWTKRPRAQYFGINNDRDNHFNDNKNPVGLFGTQPRGGNASEVFGSLFQPQKQSQVPAGGGLFGNNGGRDSFPRPNAGSLFGPTPNQVVPSSGTAFASTATPFQQRPTGGLFGSSSSTGNNTTTLFGNVSSMNNTNANNGLMRNHLDEASTIHEPKLELLFPEPSFEELGLTMTYELPGLKTLTPSFTASKCRITQIDFDDIIFSRTVIAKYKPAAYLKAKIHNSSTTTLLRGPTNLTLDNTFIGHSTLPRCSIGDTFSLNLGIDTAIKVLYPEPNVKRSTSGVFSKENCSLYTRTVTLHNTCTTTDRPINLTVFDQIPVSEDEKLRVSTLQPRGLNNGGGAVITGQGGDDGENDWGKATAQLKTNGEVVWDVRLNAGRSAKLTLEYEIALPSEETAMQC